MASPQRSEAESTNTEVLRLKTVRKRKLKKEGSKYAGRTPTPCLLQWPIPLTSTVPH